MLHDAIDLTAEVSNIAAAATASANSRMAWLARDIEQDDWLVVLDDDALDEIERMIGHMQAHPLPMLLRTPEDFELPALGRIMAKARGLLDDGPGFTVIDRLPMDRHEIDDMKTCFWIAGQMIGPPVAQKWDGTMFYDVTDTGKTYGYGVRGSRTSVELVFHTDNAFGMAVPDYVGLLCKYPAVEGGLSRFCSLYTLHDRLFEAYPDELRRLYQPMHFDRQAEHMPGTARTSFAPFFAWQDGKLAARANISLVRKGYQVAGLEPDDMLIRALKAVETVSADPEIWYEAPIQRGQMQYLNNHELGHYRSEFSDHDDPALKRHLFRTWHRRKGARSYDG